MDGVQNLRNALHPRIMELIIFPTEKCNFRCTYCYETFEIGKMKRPTIDGIRNLIRARLDKKSVDALHLSWFGGEPLLATDVLFEIAEYAKQFVDTGELKSFSGDLTTNAYLLKPDLLRRLVALNQNSFQISLDGWESGHDQTRRYVSGKGTFDVIWKNLLDAHASDLQFRIMLRLHLTEQNGDSMGELVGKLRETFKGDERFSVFFKTIENLGGPNAANISKVKVGTATSLVKEWARQLRADGFQVTAVLNGPESSKGDILDEEHAKPVNAALVQCESPVVSAGRTLPSFSGYICYAAKPNSLMIRADGRIGKCTVVLDDERNTIGKLNRDGTVEIDKERMGIWMRGFSSMDPMELGCPAQNLPKLEPREPVEVPLVRFSDLSKASTAIASDS
jgi:uncharacterized protein